jgi:hypothetical protein
MKIKTTQNVLIFLSTLILLGLLCSAASGELGIRRESLGGYNVDISQSSVSGLSAGAFMADQFFVAFSDDLVGVGIFAGGPYNCSRATLATALQDCMANPERLNRRVIDQLVTTASQRAAAGLIDSLDNLRNRKAFIFSGTLDRTVEQGVTDWVDDWYVSAGMPDANVLYHDDLAAGHTQPTLNYGNPCRTTSASPWMSDCDYDGAGEALTHIYGALNEPAPVMETSGILIEFPQNEFFDPPGLAKEQLASQFSFNEFGYAFVPQACFNREPCRIHVVFHGCKQVYDKNPDSDVADDTSNPFGLQMVCHAGYNEWAQTNNLIIIYPQAQRVGSSPHMALFANPRGCFDWWAYLAGTADTFATKEGPQMAAVYAMMVRIAQGFEGNKPPVVNFSKAEQNDTSLLVEGTVTDEDDQIVSVDIAFEYDDDQSTPQVPVDSLDTENGAFSHSEVWPKDNTVYTVKLIVKYTGDFVYDLTGPQIEVGKLCQEWTATNATHRLEGRAYRAWSWFWLRYYAVGSDDPLGYAWNITILREEKPGAAFYEQGPCVQ